MTRKTRKNRTRRMTRKGVAAVRAPTRKWSMKYKRSIDCNHPRGFSQKQHCKYGRKGWNQTKKKPKRL